MKTSIKTKLVLFIVLLLLCLLLCQLVFSLFLSRRTFVRQREEQIEALFYRIKSGYSDDSDVLYSITSDIQALYNINVEVSDGEKRIYTNRNMPPRQREERFRLPYRKEDYTEAPTARMRGAERINGEMFMPMIRLTGRFMYGDETRYVSIFSHVEPIDASVDMFTRANALIAVCVLVAGAVSAYFFAGHFARPVQEIESVAKGVAELSFDKTANEDISTAELYSLAASVNSMAENLRRMIGELESANAQLQKDVDAQKRLEKMRRSFIANVSHEMKTPLCMLMMYAENLRNEVPGIDRAYYCDTIVEEAARLNDMVRELLALSALENGLSGLCPQVLDLSESLSHLAEKAALLLEPFALETDMAPALYVQGDAHYIEQAASNFITNAIAHTESGKRISLSLAREGTSAVFRVFNEGAPIADADREQLWDSFYRADGARTQSEGMHVGLGLYIVKTIIEAHGGAYGVENEENGVTFFFSLPLAGA